MFEWVLLQQKCGSLPAAWSPLQIQWYVEWKLCGLLLRVQFDQQLQVLDNSSYPDTKLQRGGFQWDVQVVPGGVLLGQQPVQPGAHPMRHLQQEDRLVPNLHWPTFLPGWHLHLPRTIRRQLCALWECLLLPMQDRLLREQLPVQADWC